MPWVRIVLCIGIPTITFKQQKKWFKLFLMLAILGIKMSIININV